jgi:hypothetical protein
MDSKVLQAGNLVGPGEDLEVFQLRGERIRSIFYVGNLPEWEQIYISLIQDYNTLQMRVGIF